jgi:tRNA 2-selenouridine synthase
MTWRPISANDLTKLKEVLIIDVRSPCEHESENIPGSLNVPLLSNDERAIIGTLYKQEGELKARREAMRIISPKIPSIVDTIFAMRSHGQAIVIHCWRGGLRSEAVASFLSVVGLDCFRLTGGYKAWRKMVLQDLDSMQIEFKPILLQGLTGSGKTEILQELKKLGAPVLDLEELANHRGSVFGGLGLGEQPSQKNFEAFLWQKLHELNGNSYVFMEAESKKIGKLSLPACLLNAMSKGIYVLVESSLDSRCQRIIKEYAPSQETIQTQETIQSVIPMLDALKSHLGGKLLIDIKTMLEQGQIHEGVKLLLIEYYDKLYSRHIENCAPFALTVNGDCPEEAAKILKLHNFEVD